MTEPVSQAEQAFRDRCRNEVVRHGRETGRLQAFCAQRVDRFYLPHIAAENAQDAVHLLVGGYAVHIPIRFGTVYPA